MVVTISRQEIHENGATARPAFLPSERENGFPGRRPRAREVPSRYMSPSSSTTTTTSSSTSSSSSAISRRFPSPLVSRTSSNSTPRRSQSVDRRRPATPKSANASEVSAATKLLVTSTRSLSVSFQGETFSLPISKTKPVNFSNNGRKSTPERRRITPSRGKVDGDQAENPKSVDQQRWPGRTQPSNPLSRSLDCYYLEKKVIESAVLARALQESLTHESRRASIDGISNFNSGNGDVLSGIGDARDASSMNESSIPSDLTASDTESVSSGSTSGAHESNGVARGRSGPGGIMVSARFWQETQMRLRRLQDSGSMLSTSPSSKMAAPSKFNQSRKFRDEPLICPRTISSPIRGITRPASPAKLITSSTSSSLRGISPSRLRSPVAGSLNGYFCATPSVFSFYVDVRRGRVGENRIVDAHQLRLLYNRHLQWRFMNASADTALLLQRQIAEKSLWNAWRAIACICDSVRHKRTQLQLLKQKLKLTFVLRGQITYLEEWSHLDKEHLSSLQGAIKALKASTLRLPVVGGAIADIQSVKEAICSTVGVMQAMSSSMCLLFTKPQKPLGGWVYLTSLMHHNENWLVGTIVLNHRLIYHLMERQQIGSIDILQHLLHEQYLYWAQVEEVKSLLAELVNTAAKERALLEQCKHILSTSVSMQVKDCSLRTHVLQLNRLPIA